ncbi:hypothetical protein [Carnobacterium mobile]|uniref:hypothetical protein n=2 Tax=Carnobacterium mobile TaxID=2750 RepID=UPI00054EEB81|nr:hypothetical protein [Carnobacterium mobile]
MRILNLNNSLQNGSRLPEKFLNINDSTLLGSTPDEIISAVEAKIMKKINSFNNKLNISKIEYGNQTIIPGVQRTLYSSYIFDRIKISEDERDYYLQRSYIVNVIHDQLYAEKMIAYVLLSNSIQEGRNTTTTQQIFPTLADYISHFLSSPSFGYANLPIYYLNIINETITSKVMQRRLIEVEQLGIYTIDVFDKNHELYSNDYTNFSWFTNYFLTPDSGKFVGEHFEIDVNTRYIKLLDNKLSGTIVSNNGHYSFKGSQEKPLMLNILSIFIVGLKKGYTVDIHEVVNFFDNHPIEGKKGIRIMDLLSFMEKHDRGVDNL